MGSVIGWVFFLKIYMLRNGKQGFTVFPASKKIKVEEDETGKGCGKEIGAGWKGWEAS